MKKTILFDLDGTLIDSTLAILESFKVAFKSFNLAPPPDSKIKPLIGLPLEVMFIKLGVSKNKALLFVQKYKEHYKEISKQKTTLLPNAKEAILLANSFANLGVVTTKTGKYSIELLEHFNLMHYFKILVGSEDVKNHKPHPEPIIKAMHYLNANESLTWMIGDTCLDLIAAKEANIHSIGVKWEYESLEKLKSCGKIIKADALEAVNFIKDFKL